MQESLSTNGAADKAQDLRGMSAEDAGSWFMRELESREYVTSTHTHCLLPYRSLLAYYRTAALPRCLLPHYSTATLPTVALECLVPHLLYWVRAGEDRLIGVE